MHRQLRITGASAEIRVARRVRTLQHYVNTTKAAFYQFLLTSFKQFWIVLGALWPSLLSFPWNVYHLLTIGCLASAALLTRCSTRFIAKRIQPIKRWHHDVLKVQVVVCPCRPTFGRTSLLTLTLCVFLSSLCFCESVQFAQSRPYAFGPNTRSGSFQPYQDRGPRVRMPPLGLGFRGQKSFNQVERPELPHDYQSDESSRGSRWELVETDNEGVEPRYPKQSAKLPLQDTDVMHLRGYREAANDPTSFNRPYPWFKRSNDRSNVYHYGTEQNKHLDEMRINSRPQTLEQNNGYPRNRPYAAKPLFMPPYAPRARSPAYKQSKNEHYQPDDSYDSHMTDSEPFLSDFNQYPSNGEQYRDPEQPVELANRAVGHASNYGTITEEEIARHMKQYQDEIDSGSDLSLPRLPPIRAMNEHPLDATEPSSNNHLVLSGSLAHDQLAQRFLCAASGFATAGVETLFDEIDTNKDGVIRMEELRNFVWLHEVVAPR